MSGSIKFIVGEKHKDDLPTSLAHSDTPVT